MRVAKDIRSSITQINWFAALYYYNFISDKPICLPDQQRIYGVARLEEARVVCKVEAHPEPASFRWAFNNTEELIDVPVTRYRNSTLRTQSVLKYRPVTEMDYGVVLCWASNTAGQQNTACVFRIIPAGTCLQNIIANNFPRV